MAMHTSLQFTGKTPVQCTQLADELRGMLSPSAEVGLGPTRDVNGAPIGTYSVWATVYHMSELYLAYGFLRMYGGKE